jgi:hypothetical protein
LRLNWCPQSPWYLIDEYVDIISVFDVALPKKAMVADEDFRFSGWQMYLLIAQSIYNYFSHPDITE